MATDPTPLTPQPEGPTEDQVIAGHSYDGIKEYDNPMPRWWVWLFWVTVAWSVVYVPLVHFTGTLDTYEADLAEQTARLAAIRADYERAYPTFEPTEEALARFVESDASVAAGAALFANVCAACHGAQGEGGIGPNLTDAYWIHDPSDLSVFELISKGILDKGMPPWEAALSGEERAQLVAYVQALDGTDVPGGKAPQGERVD